MRGNKQMSHAAERYRLVLIAFCIMTNHFHLLIRSEDDLSKIMRQINRRYSDYYSKRYRHVGRIYQSRYFFREVDPPTIPSRSQSLYSPQSNRNEDSDGGPLG